MSDRNLKDRRGRKKKADVSEGASLTKKKGKKKGGLWKKILLVLVILCLIGGVAGVIGVNVLYAKMTGSTIVADYMDAKKIVENSTEKDFTPNQISHIYASDGTVLEDLKEGTSSDYVEYDEISPYVIDAFVAVEDESFWDNPGYDLKGMARVLINYVRTNGQVANGASTITQQLARNLYLSNEKSIGRKVKEIFIARFMTKKYDKKQIMEAYINNCCFSNNITGIEDAAKTYFGKSAKDLTLAEAAYLCAIPNRPSYYNPYDGADIPLERRNKILKDMCKCGFITEDEYKSAAAEEAPDIKKKEKVVHNYTASYAIYCAIEKIMEVEEEFQFQYEFDSSQAYYDYNARYNDAYEQASAKLYSGGYKITTSIDLDAQKKIQKAVNETLEFDQEKDDDGTYEVQGAVTAIDNQTHKVVAIVGGRTGNGDNNYTLNRAYQSTRQPGSSIKPLLVYTPGMDLDLASPNYRLKNINVEEAYNCNNSDEIAELGGTSVPLHQAVEQSLNGCALYLYNKIFKEYGNNAGLEYLYKMHFRNVVYEDRNLSAALGGLTHGTNTTEMAGGFSTLVNEGQYYKQDCLVSMVDTMGNDLCEDPQAERVYNPIAANTMVDILKGVVTQGTAAGMQWSSVSDCEAGGKTGTTNDARDGWFCGFTHYYSVAVWVGRDDHEEIAGMWGSTYPATIWKESMLALTEDLPAANLLTDEQMDNLMDDNLVEDDVDLDDDEEKKELDEEKEEKEESGEIQPDPGTGGGGNTDPSKPGGGGDTDPSKPGGDGESGQGDGGSGQGDSGSSQGDGGGGSSDSGSSGGGGGSSGSGGGGSSGNESNE